MTLFINNAVRTSLTSLGPGEDSTICVDGRRTSCPRLVCDQSMGDGH
ncbi:MAG: hypothetical protein QOJ95_5086 [Mycobacterium sp.]|jgi:hypothetical protein|nr:hypothetical protein [Mycobacterium sp.]